VLGANPAGTCYSFSTPINLATSGKPVALDLRGGCLNYTPTTATTAITLNYGVVGGTFNLGHGVFNGTLQNNGCVLGTTCGASSATAISSAGTNQAIGIKLSNLAIGGFSVGFNAQGGASNSWGAVLDNVTFASNATGLLCGNPYENLTINGGRFVINAVGIDASAGGCDIHVIGVSFDANTTFSVKNGGIFHSSGGHWENANGAGGGVTTHYITNTGALVSLTGDYFLDDQTTGNTDNWIASTLGTIQLTGATFFTGGRTATQVINVTAPSVVVGSYVNTSEATLTTFIGGTGNFNTVLAIDRNVPHQFTSKALAAGDIAKFIANSNFAGTWGINVVGAGGSSPVYIKLGGNQLNGSTAGSGTVTLPNNTGTMALQGTLTLKKGSGAGNYTTASTTYVVPDSTNLCFTVTIPTGWKLGIQASGSIGTSTAIAVASAALTDNAACATANAGLLTEAQIDAGAIGATAGFSLSWVITGDGNAHNVALQVKTAAGADSVLLLNSSATALPTMVFTLMPSN
jgi:hypothetical protein